MRSLGAHGAVASGAEGVDMTESIPSEIIEFAPAKINLTLRVIGRRADGYHELESIVVFADVGDVLRLRCHPPNEVRAAKRSATGPFAGGIIGTNLVDTAVGLVEQAVGRPLPADIVLDKRLPVASGIGGGSSDAAAALRALRTAFPDLASRVDWIDLASRLGADVPVCLLSRSAMMSGIGERLVPLCLPPLPIVMICTDDAVPADKTRRVFQELAASPLVAPVSSHRAATAQARPSDRDSLLALMRDIGNDLEIPAARILPGLAAARAALAATEGCEIVVLSGAGPTMVGVYLTTEAATHAAETIRVARPGWWVAAATTLAD